MEPVIRATVLCVVTALMALVLKKGTPEAALLLTLAASIVVLLSLSESLNALLDFLEELVERSGISHELFIPLYKTVGIALVVRVGGNLCRDAGESALGSVVETVGAVCALLAAVPLLRAVLSLLLELMQ